MTKSSDALYIALLEAQEVQAKVRLEVATLRTKLEKAEKKEHAAAEACSAASKAWRASIEERAS